MKQKLNAHMNKRRHQKGLSIEDYVRIYNMSTQEVYNIIRAPSLRVIRATNKRLNAINNLGLLDDLADKYTIKDEQTFQHKIVIPQLKREGHEIKDLHPSALKHPSRTIIDVLSILNNRIYFTEVKLRADMDSLQKAVGQLSIHRYFQEYLTSHVCKENIYQIAIPIYCKNEKILHSRLLEFLQKEMYIKIAFF